LILAYKNPQYRFCLILLPLLSKGQKDILRERKKLNRNPVELAQSHMFGDNCVVTGRSGLLDVFRDAFERFAE
jgi:hypothetical protein